MNIGTSEDIFTKCIIDTSNLNLTYLHNHLWMIIQKQGHYSSLGTSPESAYFIVNKLSVSDSELVRSHLLDKNFYFDSNGHIYLYDDTTKVKTIDNKTIGTAQDPPPESAQKGKLKIINNDVVMSEQLSYILYYDTPNSVYVVLINPVHRKLYRDFSDQTLVASNEDKQNFLKEYCHTFKVPNKYNNDELGYADYSCNCFLQIGDIDTEGYFVYDTTDQFKVSYLSEQQNGKINVSNVDKSTIDQDALLLLNESQIFCSNSSCQNIPTNSFLNDFVSSGGTTISCDGTISHISSGSLVQNDTICDTPNSSYDTDACVCKTEGHVVTEHNGESICNEPLSCTETQTTEKTDDFKLQCRDIPQEPEITEQEPEPTETTETTKTTESTDIELMGIKMTEQRAQLLGNVTTVSIGLIVSKFLGIKMGIMIALAGLIVVNLYFVKRKNDREKSQSSTIISSSSRFVTYNGLNDLGSVDVESVRGILANSFPIGTILPLGTTDTVFSPKETTNKNFVKCDGQNGTPDLYNNVMIAAKNNTLDTTNIGVASGYWKEFVGVHYYMITQHTDQDFQCIVSDLDGNLSVESFQTFVKENVLPKDIIVQYYGDYSSPDWVPDNWSDYTTQPPSIDHNSSNESNERIMNLMTMFNAIERDNGTGLYGAVQVKFLKYENDNRTTTKRILMVNENNEHTFIDPKYLTSLFLPTGTILNMHNHPVAFDPEKNGHWDDEPDGWKMLDYNTHTNKFLLGGTSVSGGVREASYVDPNSIQVMNCLTIQYMDKFICKQYFDDNIMTRTYQAPDGDGEEARNLNTGTNSICDKCSGHTHCSFPHGGTMGWKLRKYKPDNPYRAYYNHT